MGDSYTAYRVPAKTAAAMTFIYVKEIQNYWLLAEKKRQSHHI